MKSTFNQLLKFTAYTTVMALFFSCTPATGGSTIGSGSDTGTGTTTTGTTGGSTTGSGTDTGTGTTITGTSGVSFSTTYNDPALPENIGTDPFKGHTYRNTYSGSTGSSDISFTFGNNGELTYTSTGTSGTTTTRNGTKYSYSYDATTKELSLKCTHILQKVPGPTEYEWYTYAELINFILNITRSQLAEMGDPTTYTDEQLKELIQNNCIHIKNEFETTKIWKAELNTSNNLVLRTSYYKTAPSSLPNNSAHYVIYTIRQGSFYLSIGPTTTDTSNSSSNESGSFLYSKGLISTFSNSAGTSTPKIFSITNITSNTISAVEVTFSSSGYTIVSGGVTLELSYTYALGNDNNLLVTVTGSDDTTKDFLRTLLGDNTLTNPSITASSYTEPTTYTFVE
ncbi:MAG: hypothetical protein MR424_01225 [Treponema sp.]|nr:hypothetical protein [Treponema sp.]